MKNLILIIALISPCMIGLNKMPYNVINQELQNIKSHIVLLKRMPEIQLHKIAMGILKASKANKVNSEIMTSIIMVESSFNQRAISSTGDISIVQINYRVWSKEAKRLNFELSQTKLKSDAAYAIDRMGVILGHLKKKYSSRDPYWFARYHSNTKELKMAYFEKVKKNFTQSLASN